MIPSTNKYDFILDANATLVDVHELTSLCFKSNTYIQNFPQVFKSQNSNYFFLLRHQNKAVCFCTIYPTYFLLDQGGLRKGFCVGSVCTHPDYRRQGLASLILKYAEEKAFCLQGDFVYLFSAENKLYEKAGYHFSGEAPLAELSSKSKILKIAQKLKIFNSQIKSFAEGSFSTENSFSLAQIWSFIVQHSKASESLLSYLEMQDIMKIKNMQVYYLTHNQKLCAVGFLNKGDDFQNVIHGIYFSHLDYAILLINKLFLQEGKNKKLHFFPGAFAKEFSTLFEFQMMPAMYAKVLQKECQKAELSELFVRSIQGT